MNRIRGFRDWPALLSDLLERAAPLLDQPHLESVRDGLTSLAPVLIVGSMSLLLRELPLSEWQTLVATNAMIPRGLQAVFKLTYGSFSLWAVCSIAGHLARRKRLRSPWPAGLAVLVFAVLVLDRVRPTLVARLGPESLLLAIVAALLTVEGYSRIRAAEPVSVEQARHPRILLAAIRGVLLTLGMSGIALLVRLALCVGVGSAAIRLASHLASLLSSGPVCVLAEGAHALLWVTGIDGNLILGSALQPILTGGAVGNGLARWSGQMPRWIYTDLFRAYVTAGGSGATLPLAFYLSRSRSTRLRRLGRTSLLPGLFNLNTGLVFGAPIIFNPLLALPFVTTTVVNATAAYWAHVVGWVTPAYIYLPRVIPSPLYALISTGYDIRAVALSVATLLVIPGIIWIPFFRAWERRVLAAESMLDHPDIEAAQPGGLLQG